MTFALTDIAKWSCSWSDFPNVIGQYSQATCQDFVLIAVVNIEYIGPRRVHLLYKDPV